MDELEQTVKEAVQWGKRNNKNPDQVAERVRENISQSVVDEKRLINLLTHYSEKLGYGA